MLTAETNFAHPSIRTFHDVSYDSNVMRPIRLQEDQLNLFISNRKGIMPGTITMVTGDPGAGKTTMLCEWAVQIQNQGKRVLLIESEMDDLDFIEYVERFPGFGNLPIFFVDFERNIKNDLEQVLELGWDLVIIDSFKDLQEKISEQEGRTKTSTEMYLINLLKNHKSGTTVDNHTYYTAFYVIQQVLKSGEFAGSNSLKHLLTAHLALKYDGNEPYMVYLKNRRGATRKKMYYTISENTITYDFVRRSLEEDALNFIEEEQEHQQVNREAFLELVRTSNERETVADQVVAQALEEASQVESLTVEMLTEALERFNFNMTKAHTYLVENKMIPQSYSKYKLTKFADENNVERRSYKNN